MDKFHIRSRYEKSDIYFISGSPVNNEPVD